MIDIRCSRDGLKCDDCPIIKECEQIELTEEIDAYSLYEKGRADMKREIEEHSLFYSSRPIEDIVLETRADAIDDYTEWLRKTHANFDEDYAEDIKSDYLKQLKE